MRPLALLLLLLLPASAAAGERAPFIDTNPPYVQIIVTACPPAETPLEPTNFGKSYENERGMTREERTAYFRSAGCVEVPIPAEVITQELSYRQCMGPSAISPPCNTFSRMQPCRARPMSGSGPAFPGTMPSPVSPISDC